MATKAEVTKPDAVAIAKNSIYSVLTNERTLQAIRDALPELGVTPQRVASIAFSTISRSPQLLKCEPRSLVRVVIETSLLGLSLDPHLKQAAIVPFKNGDKYEATLIVEYMGLVKLARNSGVLQDVDAHVVYEKDEFDFELGLNPKLFHKPHKGAKGKPIAVYAVGVLTSGDRRFRVLYEDEVNFYREKSRAKDSPDSPWSTDPMSMWRKTAIRRLCGYLPMDEKTQRAIHDDEMAETGNDQVLAPEFFDAVIDVVPEQAKKSKTDEQKEKLKERNAQTERKAIAAVPPPATDEDEPEEDGERIANQPMPADEAKAVDEGPQPESEKDRKAAYAKAFDALSKVCRSEKEADVEVSAATKGKVQSVKALKETGTIAQMEAVEKHADALKS